MTLARPPVPLPAWPGGAGRNVFTVDLEEWFHVCCVPALGPERWHELPSRIESTTMRLLDVLEEAEVRATFFVVGWVAEQFPRLVEAVREAGHEIGSHSHWHQRVYDLGRERFKEDLRRSIGALKASGVPDVSMFRAPEWSVNERSLWALDVLVEEGVGLDASMAPIRMVGSVTFPRYPHLRVTTNGSIVEVPPFVAERFGQVIPLGWGWGLRMSSPRRVVKAIEQTNLRGWPAVLTVHPWEIDPDPPRARLPIALHFAHYFRLDGFADRLRTILDGAQFGPLGDLASHVTPPARADA